MSNKFVPYRPDYDKVSSAVDYVNHVNPKGQSTVTGGDLNSITINEERVYNNPSNLPSETSGFVICKTTIVDGNSAYQKLQFITSQSTTKYAELYPVFTRAKTSGTWRSWMHIDTNGSYRLDDGSSQALSKSFNISNWNGGTYLITVINAQDSTNRWGVSAYLYYKSTSYTPTLFTPIVEVEHAKISSFTIANDGTVTMTYDYNGYHVVNCRRI